MFLFDEEKPEKQFSTLIEQFTGIKVYVSIKDTSFIVKADLDTLTLLQVFYLFIIIPIPNISFII